MDEPFASGYEMTTVQQRAVGAPEKKKGYRDESTSMLDAGEVA